MNERQYQEIKELLAQLTAKIDALYDSATTSGPVSDFELETGMETKEIPVQETASFTPDNADAKSIRSSAGTVGDLFSDMAKRPTVADSLARTKKKGPLKEHIPFNDKFLYMKTLFSGDDGLYEKTLADLQSMDNMQQAEKYLAEHFPPGNYQLPQYRNF